MIESNPTAVAEPKFAKHALQFPKWKATMDAKCDALLVNSTWYLVIHLI